MFWLQDECFGVGQLFLANTMVGPFSPFGLKRVVGWAVEEGQPMTRQNALSEQCNQEQGHQALTNGMLQTNPDAQCRLFVAEYESRSQWRVGCCINEPDATKP